MSKISKNKLAPNTYNSILESLISVLVSLNTKKDMTDLIDSLFTQTERLMLAKRLAIALLLDRGMNYKEISKLIKVSSVTISFVRNGIMKNNESYINLIKLFNELKI
jgi:uncharacterized protein YerC